MHEHVVEHAAESIFRVGVLGRDLHRFGDRDAEASRRVGMRLENGAPRIGFVARARHAVCAISLHERAPVGLLVIGDLDHVDLDFEAEQRAGEGERRAPLSRAGFGRKPGDALLLVIESLGDRGVRLVAAGGAHALILIENARVRSERLLEPPRAIEGRRAPHAVDVADRRRDFDMPLGADLLANERHREEGREVGWARPAGPCPDAAPAAAETASRRRCCTRRGECDPRP